MMFWTNQDRINKGIIKDINNRQKMFTTIIKSTTCIISHNIQKMKLVQTTSFTARNNKMVLKLSELFYCFLND